VLAFVGGYQVAAASFAVLGLAGWSLLVLHRRRGGMTGT
jgi:hypothetical protein